MKARLFLPAAGLFFSNLLPAQLNTDIYLCDFKLDKAGINCTQPENITARAGYDNQPSFSNKGNVIYYSANYTGTNDIYSYDIAAKKTFVITNTPATSEFSPMQTPEGNSIMCVFIERDSVTQRLWKIMLKNRKEKLFSKHNDSIGYYWPIETQWTQFNVSTSGTGVRMAQVERDYAVFVLGNKEDNNTLRIITPTRKAAKERIIDDSVGRCIRQMDHYITYVKKTAKGNYIRFYNQHTRKVEPARFFLGATNEDYCWTGKTLLYTAGTKIIAVNFDKGHDQPVNMGEANMESFGISNLKRISVSGNKLAFVADDM